MRLLIYVSSPYSCGDQAANVRRQIDVGHELMDRGHSVILPNLTHFMQIVRPRDYEEWLRMDEHIIERCDVVLRLPGASPGADREVEHAEKNHVLVVHSVEELDTYCRHYTDHPEAP